MKKIIFDIPKNRIASVSLETNFTRQKSARKKTEWTDAVAPSWSETISNSSNVKKALVISSTKGIEAYFSGKTSEMRKWQEVLGEKL